MQEWMGEIHSLLPEKSPDEPNFKILNYKKYKIQKTHQHTKWVSEVNDQKLLIQKISIRPLQEDPPKNNPRLMMRPQRHLFAVMVIASRAMSAAPLVT